MMYPSVLLFLIIAILGPTSENLNDVTDSDPTSSSDLTVHHGTRRNNILYNNWPVANRSSVQIFRKGPLVISRKYWYPVLEISIKKVNPTSPAFTAATTLSPSTEPLNTLPKTTIMQDTSNSPETEETNILDETTSKTTSTVSSEPLTTIQAHPSQEKTTGTLPVSTPTDSTHTTTSNIQVTETVISSANLQFTIGDGFDSLETTIKENTPSQASSVTSDSTLAQRITQTGTTNLILETEPPLLTTPTDLGKPPPATETPASTIDEESINRPTSIEIPWTEDTTISATACNEHETSLIHSTESSRALTTQRETMDYASEVLTNEPTPHSETATVETEQATAFRSLPETTEVNTRSDQTETIEYKETSTTPKPFSETPEHALGTAKQKNTLMSVSSSTTSPTSARSMPPTEETTTAVTRKEPETTMGMVTVIDQKQSTIEVELSQITAGHAATTDVIMTQTMPVVPSTALETTTQVSTLKPETPLVTPDSTSQTEHKSMSQMPVTQGQTLEVSITVKAETQKGTTQVKTSPFSTELSEERLTSTLESTNGSKTSAPVSSASTIPEMAPESNTSSTVETTTPVLNGSSSTLRTSVAVGTLATGKPTGQVVSSTMNPDTIQVTTENSNNQQNSTLTSMIQVSTSVSKETINNTAHASSGHILVSTSSIVLPSTEAIELKLETTDLSTNGTTLPSNASYTNKTSAVTSDKEASSIFTSNLEVTNTSTQVQTLPVPVTEMGTTTGLTIGDELEPTEVSSSVLPSTAEDTLQTKNTSNLVETASNPTSLEPTSHKETTPIAQISEIATNGTTLTQETKTQSVRGSSSTGQTPISTSSIISPSTAPSSTNSSSNVTEAEIVKSTRTPDLSTGGTELPTTVFATNNTSTLTPDHKASHKSTFNLEETITTPNPSIQTMTLAVPVPELGTTISLTTENEQKPTKLSSSILPTTNVDTFQTKNTSNLVETTPNSTSLEPTSLKETTPIAQISEVSTTGRTLTQEPKTQSEIGSSTGPIPVHTSSIISPSTSPLSTKSSSNSTETSDVNSTRTTDLATGGTTNTTSDQDVSRKSTSNLEESNTTPNPSTQALTLAVPVTEMDTTTGVTVGKGLELNITKDAMPLSSASTGVGTYQTINTANLVETAAKATSLEPTFHKETATIPKIFNDSTASETVTLEPKTQFDTHPSSTGRLTGRSSETAVSFSAEATTTKTSPNSTEAGKNKTTIDKISGSTAHLLQGTASFTSKSEGAATSVGRTSALPTITSGTAKATTVRNNTKEVIVTETSTTTSPELPPRSPGTMSSSTFTNKSETNTTAQTTVIQVSNAPKDTTEIPTAPRETSTLLYHSPSTVHTSENSTTIKPLTQDPTKQAESSLSSSEHSTTEPFVTTKETISPNTSAVPAEASSHLTQLKVESTSATEVSTKATTLLALTTRKSTAVSDTVTSTSTSASTLRNDTKLTSTLQVISTPTTTGTTAHGTLEANKTTPAVVTSTLKPSVAGKTTTQQAESNIEPRLATTTPTQTTETLTSRAPKEPASLSAKPNSSEISTSVTTVKGESTTKGQTGSSSTGATTVNKFGTTYPTTTTTVAITRNTDPPLLSEGSMSLKFSLNETFKEVYKDKASPEFLTLATQVVDQVNLIYMSSNLTGYKRSRVNAFTSGSIKVDMTLIFENTSIVPSSKAVETILSAGAVNITMHLMAETVLAGEIVNLIPVAPVTVQSSTGASNISSLANRWRTPNATLAISQVIFILLTQSVAIL